MSGAMQPTAAVTDGKLVKLRGMPLADVLALASLPATAHALAAAQADVPAAVLGLRAGGLPAEAARLVAFALPRREAVWWACMCARAVPPEAVRDNDLKALEYAEAWVYRQGDEARRSAFEQAQAAEFATPEAWAAVAAFWSGDSMSPLGQPPVPPAANLAGTAVAGAVTLAAVRSRPERRAERLERFLDSAIAIADGGSGRMPPEPP